MFGRRRKEVRRHVAPLGASSGDERGDQWSLEADALDRFLGRGELQAGDPVRLRGLSARREYDTNDLSLAVAVARDEHERVAANGELAGFLAPLAVRVAEVVQAIHQLSGGDGLAALELERPRENARIRPLQASLDTSVDHPGEHHVVVPDDNGKNRERHAQTDGRIELPAPAAPASAQDAARCAGWSVRGEGSGHGPGAFNLWTFATAQPARHAPRPSRGAHVYSAFRLQVRFCAGQASYCVAQAFRPDRAAVRPRPPPR